MVTLGNPHALLVTEGSFTLLVSEKQGSQLQGNDSSNNVNELGNRSSSNLAFS